MALHEREEETDARKANSHHRSLPELGKEIRREAHALASSLESTARDLRDVVSEGLRDHPYRTLALAAAAGFVLGGGVATRMTRLALLTGARLAIAVAMQRVTAGIEESVRPARSQGGASLPPAMRSI